MRLEILPPPADRPSELILAGLEGERPLGVAIAEYDAANENARVSSIVVSPEHRRRGVATALFTAMERELQARGARRIELSFERGEVCTPAVDRLLERRSFPEAQGLLVCTGSARAVESSAPWMQTQIAAGDELFCWSELGEDEARAIRAAGGYPKEVDPFEETAFEPINSLGLRRGGEVVAWLITSRRSPEVIAFSRLFVRPDRRARARGVALVAEAIRRQSAAGVPQGMFLVRSANKNMRRFVERRVAPYLQSIAETMFAAKTI